MQKPAIIMRAITIASCVAIISLTIMMISTNQARLTTDIDRILFSSRSRTADEVSKIIMTFTTWKANTATSLAVNLMKKTL